jgi:uncharacterized membrane protein YfcA
MPLTPSQFLLVGAILLASSVVQGAVGFASGMFATPLLMLIGITLPDSVAISMVASALQNITAAWQLRQQIDYRLALRPMLLRFATLPLGVWALFYVGKESSSAAGQIVGAVVLAIVLVQWAFSVAPRPHLHVAWEWIAFACGGFLLGLCGMGGPAMVLWVMAHDWPMHRAKAFLYYIFATGVPLQALFLWLAFGNEILIAMLIGLMVFPLVLLGLYFGLFLGRRVSDRTLRQLSLAVLLLIAVSALVGPYWR